MTKYQKKKHKELKIHIIEIQSQEESIEKENIRKTLNLKKNMKKKRNIKEILR